MAAITGAIIAVGALGLSAYQAKRQHDKEKRAGEEQAAVEASRLNRERLDEAARTMAVRRAQLAGQRSLAGARPTSLTGPLGLMGAPATPGAKTLLGG